MRRSAQAGASAEADMKVILGRSGGFDWRASIVFALGALFVAFFQAPGALVEQHNRREVLARGHETVAWVERSTGLQAVAITWIDASGQARQGEARTRKQVSGRSFVGKQVTIKYADDPKIPPVILTEVADRAWDNTFWIYLNPVLVMGFVGIAIAFRRYTTRSR